MSLELKIAELTEAVAANTEALLGSSNIKTELEKDNSKKTARKPRTTRKAAKPEPEDEDEEDEEEEEEEEPAPKAKKRTRKTTTTRKKKVAVTQDDIRGVGTKIIKEGGAEEFKEILEQFGVNKTSELDESDYVEVKRQLDEVLVDLLEEE